MKCIQIIVSGKVQGVFFRDSVRRKAVELGIVGYARNLSDGTVEVVAQGTKKQVDALIDFINSNPGYSAVKEINSKESALEDFHGFEIQ